MKKLAAALVATLLAAPAVAPAQDIAPAVKRKPVAASATPAPSPAAAATSSTPAAARQSVAASAAPAAPQQASRTANEREIQAALTAAAGHSGGDVALDSSLIRVMTRLAAAGRCGEAASLAARDGRTELASRARQLCK